MEIQANYFNNSKNIKDSLGIPLIKKIKSQHSSFKSNYDSF